MARDAKPGTASGTSYTPESAWSYLQQLYQVKTKVEISLPLAWFSFTSVHSELGFGLLSNISSILKKTTPMGRTLLSEDEKQGGMKWEDFVKVRPPFELLRNLPIK